MDLVHTAYPCIGIVKMCHGHPHNHICGHQSVTWHYCPKAAIDLTTGYETTCKKTTFASSQPSSAGCPLQNCEFNACGGSWTCCVCKQGPNTLGWCSFIHNSWRMNSMTQEWEWIQTCGHGYCKDCTRDREFGGFVALPPPASMKTRSNSASASTAAPKSRSRKHR